MAGIKQVIAVRTDLQMGKGKIAAQVAHASLLGAENVRKSSLAFENPLCRNGVGAEIGIYRGALHS